MNKLSIIRLFSSNPGIILFLLICSTGCLSHSLVPEPSTNLTLTAGIGDNAMITDIVPDLIPQETMTPAPEPTSSVEHVSMNRTFNFNPSPRVSVGYENTIDARIPLHTVYIEKGLDLNGTPLGRILTILHGPFIVDYAINPKVNNPLVEWATIELEDPWGNLVEKGGYNRHYPAASHQQMLIYRTGTYYLKMEGDFVTIDIGVRTTDPVPDVTPTQEPVEEE